MTVTDAEPTFDIDDPQYVVDGDESPDSMVLAGDDAPPPLLPGKAWMTIATLASTAAFVLTTVATAALTFAGALPEGLRPFAGDIIQWCSVASALGLGLGALAKAWYAQATARVLTSPPGNQ